MTVSSRRHITTCIGAALMLAAAVLAPAYAQDATAPAPAAETAVPAPDTVVATVNGSEITEADLALALNDLDPQFQQLPPDQRRAAALSAIIEIRLLAAKSTEAGVADKPEFQRRMEFLRQRALHSEYVANQIADSITDEMVRARYDQEIANTPPVNEIKASHILVPTEEEAKAIIAELDAGGDFAAIAKEKSKDGAAQNGGDLGYFTQGRMVPEFEQAAFALDVGAYSKTPVQTQFGWHVIKVEDKRAQQPPAFDAVQGQIKSLLLREKYFSEVEAARAAAKVDIADAALKTALDGPAEGEAQEAPAETPAQQ